MYARLTFVQMRPDKVQEGIELYDSSVVPAARIQPGNHGAWLLADRATGKVIFFTVWDTPADIEASELSGYYREQIGKFTALMMAPPVREVYEIAVQG